MTILRALSIPLAFLVLGAVACHSGGVPPQAESDAEAWLALVDQGRYAESWNAASEHFKRSVDAGTWEKQATAVRGSLGPLRSRALKSATRARSLPGAPDGEYVVFQFDASFDQKAAAVETITVSKEEDSAWRASGYYVR